MNYHEFFVDAGDKFPDEQSPEEILRILDRRKTGDYAHIFPKGDKQIWMLENGLPQAYGVVDEESPEGEMTLWGTLFALPPHQKAFAPPEARTFGLLDIEIVRFVPAEIHIPRATKGRFRYLSPATVRTAQGTHDVIIDSFIDGILSGKSPDGQRATGGASFFTPK